MLNKKWGKANQQTQEEENEPSGTAYKLAFHQGGMETLAEIVQEARRKNQVPQIKKQTQQANISNTFATLKRIAAP